jgi:hypothetical protein
MIANIQYAVPSENDAAVQNNGNQPASNSIPGHGDSERLVVVASDGSQWVRVEIQASRDSVLQPLERQVLLRAQQKLVEYFCRHTSSGQFAVSADLRGLRIVESVERHGKIKLVIEVPLQTPDCNRITSDSSSSAVRTDRSQPSRKNDDSDRLSPKLLGPKAGDERASDYRNRGEY